MPRSCVVSSGSRRASRPAIYIFEQIGKWRHGDGPRIDAYSGYREGKNNPLAQHQVGIGPIPVGAYWIGTMFDSPEHGPVSMHLIPITGTELFGRAGFLIHGDSAAHPGEASRGCIILPRDERERIAASADRLLIVLSGK